MTVAKQLVLPLKPKKKARTKQWNMRMNVEEWQRTQRLAAEYGISVSDVIRMLIKREYDRIVGAE